MVKEMENTKKTLKTSRKTSTSAGASENADKTAQEQIENDKVGAILYNERLKKGLNLADISQVLCIRRAYLDAIEKGNYAELPPMPYSAGFVNSYAKYLGLNHTRITQLFREEINVKPHNASSFVNEDIPTEVSLPNKIYVLASIAAAFLIVCLWGMLSSSNNNELEPSFDESAEQSELKVEEEQYFVKEEDDDVPAVIEVKPLTEENTQVVISEESYVENKKEKTAPKIEIKITKEDTWLEVRDAKKVYISKILRVGESYVLPDVEGLKLSSGKYKGVEVYVDGKLTPLITANKKMKIDIDGALKNTNR
ncbi:MAG: DUF4115 domain-containing protein [Alphaproteobacteria bacterium]|nr:DUF4115 domain-containing protein [Alphaproteobacteria bacterium]